MWYTLYEFNRASLEPLRLAARASARLWEHPLNPAAYTPLGHTCSLACHALDRIIGSYGPRSFDRSELEALRSHMVRRTRHGFSATILPFVRPNRAAS